jgi:hypothetical protein
VGYFRSNKVDRELSATALQELIVKHCDQNKTLLSYEKNTYGDLFYHSLIDNSEKVKEFMLFDQSIIAKYYNETGTKFTYGIKLTSGNKSNHCKLFKESYERDKIINNSYHLSVELGNFNDDGTGHYKAVYGHDDMVMTAVQLEFVKETLQYKLLRTEFDSDIAYEKTDDIYNPFEQPFDWEYLGLDSMNNSSRLGGFRVL